MATIDIFNDDAFSVVSLTDAVDAVEYQPSLLRDMGLFEKQPVRTTTIAMERRDGVISLIPVSERGEPLDQATKGKRNIRHASAGRLAKGDTIYADELQNVRAFGKETETQAVQKEVATRFAGIQQDMELTEENMFLGAIQGKVLDADGKTVLYDWFDFWGVSQPTEIDFDLDNASPATGALKKKCKQVIRGMQKASKGAFTPKTEVIGFCGDNFFDDLVAQVEELVTTINPADATMLANEFGTAYGAIKFGEIIWINYRGTDDDSKLTIGTDKVRFFPRKAKGVFKHALAPAEFMPYVNTLGKERYAMTIPDRDRGAFTKVELYSYPLVYCTRPELLFRGKRT